MRNIVLVCTLIFLASCGPKSTDIGQDDKTPNKVVLVAIAPDGTHLWGVAGTNIYFSSSGTQHTVNCGKNCTRIDRIPNTNYNN